MNSRSSLKFRFVALLTLTISIDAANAVPQEAVDAVLESVKVSCGGREYDPKIWGCCNDEPYLLSSSYCQKRKVGSCSVTIRYFLKKQPDSESCQSLIDIDLIGPPRSGWYVTDEGDCEDTRAQCEPNSKETRRLKPEERLCYDQMPDQGTALGVCYIQSIYPGQQKKIWQEDLP